MDVQRKMEACRDVKTETAAPLVEKFFHGTTCVTILHRAWCRNAQISCWMVYRIPLHVAHVLLRLCGCSVSRSEAGCKRLVKLFCNCEILKWRNAAKDHECFLIAHCHSNMTLNRVV